ncbi:phosphatase [Leptolyngbya sp. 'hensonii']|uniref:HAD hydrolase-like protein n=1 Tax=Leptolyngbya sp. 'hensonii' TaxID=1922337 RepID=UPI000962A14F|nr:HAD hydrolase-like protein [Leptolyngbya sp. 'hensonii']OLP16737.1 phosphatase [Leptolyngbya sp. 'hensonii']
MKELNQGAPIELVVLDMAGTTVKDNREVEKCFLEAADHTGLTIAPERCNAMMGLSKKQVFQTLWDEQIGRQHPEYETKVEASFAVFKQVLETHYQTQPVVPTEGCLELFAWLKAQNIKIALTTGFYREVTQIILNRLGWDQGLNQEYLGSAESIIQASITPSEIFNNEGRPAPYMIQKAMYRLGVRDSRQVINIGDTPSDLAAGHHANCLYSFAVTNGTHTRSELEAYPHDGLFDSLRDFQTYLAVA